MALQGLLCIIREILIVSHQNNENEAKNKIKKFIHIYTSAQP